MTRKGLAAVLILTLTIVGCSSTPTFQTGPYAEVSYDGLTRMKGTVMDAVWARTDIDLTGFSKIMFENLGVEYRSVTGPYSGGTPTTSRALRRASEFQLNEETKALFEELVSSAFLQEMKRSTVFTLVDQPAADVLLVRVGLLDVVSRVPPQTMGSSRIFIDSVGEATLVLELRDSVSNTIFARAVDRRAARQPEMIESTPAANRGEVRRLGRRWGGILRTALDQLLTEPLMKPH